MLRRKKQEPSDEQTQQKTLRLRPGVVIVILQWLVWFVVPIVIPGSAVVGVFGGLLGGLAILVWWAVFSRAPRFERWGAVILMIVALVATSQIIHESIATAMQGGMFLIFSVPVMSLALVVWAVASLNLSDRPRRLTMVITILLASGVWILLRTEGMTGEARHDFEWRWSKTNEERFLAQTSKDLKALPLVSEAIDTEAEWPGFRGPNRDGIIHGVNIETDWSASSPAELWRRKIGPGCSSFAVHGTLLYTQEQRGDDEIVACYNMTTGEPVWLHRDAARFWDSHAGSGPRSTPTLSNGRVYTFGATGILNVLDAGNGEVVWSRNAASDTDTELPGWGFTSSPLVVHDVVIVATAGSLVAYDLDTGDPRWLGPDGGTGYSSPHLMTIAGVEQILLMNGVGAISVAPADGMLLWELPWPQDDRILQPALTEDGDVLLNTGGAKGMRRIAVSQGPDGWTIKERWTSVQLKSIFNDFVVHKGHAFGFVGPSLACIDIRDGKRKWKGGRYGGQIVLLADQDLLLVLTEKGELALVEAIPDQLTELARFPAIEGKTWNHPVLVGDILLVRNTQEMVAFRLPLAGD
jgi:outer membrane protein assembly factor BamB